MAAPLNRSHKAGLNPQQLAAVEQIQGPLLIVAGAGSGKTRVITARIAEMVQKGIPPQAILALTFTNKAAREMEDRVKKLTGQRLKQLNIFTFHAFGLRILKEKTLRMGYRPRFTIYDSQDKTACLKEAAREQKLTHEAGEIQALAQFFSDIKTRRVPWDDTNKVHLPLYNEYAGLMRIYNAVDFDDLIIKPLELFEDGGEVLEEYRSRYRYILVDEFQDTSQVQYKLVRSLALGHRSLCCVGDDDQSIYSWRGADYNNIVAFEKDFPERQEIKLERNYRSTGVILQAANAVIAQNTRRKAKKLWTEDQQGERTIRCAQPDDDRAEGAFIADSIGALRTKENMAYNDIGILVRVNSLTKSIEESLLARNIPYQISGGTSFFQRQEIKDVIAYLRVIDNPDDDVSLLRIVNIPRRGIGKTTLVKIISQAREKGCSLYSAITSLVFDPGSSVGQKIRSGLAEFIDLVEKYQELFSGEKPPLAETLTALIEEVEYWGHLVQEFQNNEKVAKWRYENIKHLTNFLERWEKNPDNLEPVLTRWLRRITLVTRDEIEGEEAGKVNLMTIHASKGLEFEVVFLAGVEDGIIPHAKSLEENPQSLEEERRLFYVAITRARKILTATSCRMRRMRQETRECLPSPFLEEIPEEIREIVEVEEPVETGENSQEYFARMPWNKD